jgi:hypothetical protein
MSNLKLVNGLPFHEFGPGDVVSSAVADSAKTSNFTLTVGTQDGDFKIVTSGSLLHFVLLMLTESGMPDNKNSSSTHND